MTKFVAAPLLVALAIGPAALAHDRSTRAEVREAQEQLDTLGYPVGGIDGRIGDRTRTAIRNFQRDKGLNATGQLDHDTFDALADAAADNRRAAADERHAEPGDHAMSSSIRRAQTKLERLGYPVETDGELGTKTRTALRNFQRDRGLNATGELDQDTLEALDADTGSETSGARSR
jgi:peptidoglycan hydrolase-like protein with peptidoglycan-binding domain